jgi:hypothetical protein
MYCDHCGRPAEHTIRVDGLVFCAECAELIDRRAPRSDSSEAVAWWLLQMFRDNSKPVIIYDPHTLRFIDANDMALRLAGFQRADLNALTIADVVESHGELLQILERRFDKISKAGPVMGRGPRGSVAFNTIAVLTEFEGRPCRVVALYPVKSPVSAGPAARS